ncbi:DUF5615 family PIN-like protein [Methylobacterium oxalidis]|uniref:DUF5615 domain-containing protein n=1 Tax=Methylobacterium oxalidis TaxID=944322 RepID=A0A512J8D6_9HYPH|nr:DUF5615 family PIN-like protein [Methylobacterium oxalidis]GEP06202.1 hypothetical protein MOX02_42400 [Methylobacterium oxalidis]GJE33824.1 hypothetical protein LDDCCGHA_4027 [Methylobacterium oxalidis]GLS62982.1 hypothetical protein GCM10007888_13630 [Methylobacterium oxalidis]
MNLSTDWVPYLAGLGHDAVHWASVGRPDTADADILAWARAQDRVILTNDLDFGTMLIVSGAQTPSVVQLRTDITLAAHVGPLVAQAVLQTASALGSGALVTVETGRVRLRPLIPDPEV